MYESISIGDNIGKLRILSLDEKTQMAECMCVCGRVVQRQTASLMRAMLRGSISMCKYCKAATYKGTHMQSKSRLYEIWCGMKKRCYNKKAPAYSYYGARGIMVCEQWLNSFETFAAWSLEHGYNDNLSIDRTDNAKGYSPDNCRWVDAATQRINTRPRFNRFLQRRIDIPAVARAHGIKPDTLRHRLRRGLSLEEAIY